MRCGSIGNFSAVNQNECVQSTFQVHEAQRRRSEAEREERRFQKLWTLDTIICFPVLTKEGRLAAAARPVVKPFQEVHQACLARRVRGPTVRSEKP